ncbi:carbon-nitrogen hydrolase [Trichoderma novae-zelandiae]
MRIACLQFAPQVGDVENNLSKADAVLNEADSDDLDLDLLVLPELAFTGYNFKSLGHISPYLEESSTGISSLWARNTALKHDCTVVVGYPEKVDPTLNWPTDPEYYNSAIAVNGDGETVANYRKTHLYYTDETWALEGSHGFFGGRLPGLGQTAMGICMDLNPYKFEAPWNKFEFGQHVLNSGARLVIVSMAWLTNENAQEFTSTPLEPDSMTLLYWVSRLEPLIRAESNQEVIVIFANRCGIEGEATYAGTSTVVGIQSGEIWVYGIMGRGEKGLLVVDTDSEPYAKLAYSPLQPKMRSGNDVAAPESEASSGNDPYPQDETLDQFLGSSVYPHKPSLDDSRDQYKNDVSTWHADSSHHLGGRKDYESPDYHGQPFDHETAEPQIAHTARASTPKLDIKSFQLDIPPDQYMLRRYLEAESPISHLESSRFPNHSTTAAPEGLRDLQKVPDEYAPFYPDMMENEKRFSLRSDVSVWNNQPGRVRQISVSRIDAPDLSHITTQERSRTAEAGSGSRPEEPYRSKHQTHSQRYSDWNSRHGSDYGVPLSRQSSQNQLGRKYSQNQIDDMARSYSSSAVLPAHLLQTHTASQVASEETGRGRRRSSHKHIKDGRRGSRGTQMSHREPVDLSQFTLIEEYPSVSCPVHGSRPPSGTRHQNHSRARGRSGSHSQHLKEGDAARRPSTRRDTSQNESQRDNNGRASRRTHSSKPEQARSGNEKKREDKNTTNTNSGPRTPTAMLLIPDAELPDGLDKSFSLLKCVEKPPEHIVRRRVSSIW